MIKIEKLINGASATFVRDNVRMPIFLYQLLTHEELNTLIVKNGTVVYSIDELSIEERTADTVVEPTAPAEPKSEQIELTLETPVVVAEETVETVIVKPANRVVKPAVKAKK
jgi:hypothetical protein